jgi:hypothetical protein
MAGIELCKFTHGLGLYIQILPRAIVNLHNSMPAMNYFDSNRTKMVIFNLS